jgi:4-amino-4-deoxy-L-arabinose transferase-like glycosyltransferase
MSPARLVLLIILGGTLVRLAFAATTGLGMDESYSVGNARILSLSYVDHPPLHLWLAGVAARLFGTEASLVVRLPFVLLFAGSTWLMFVLTRALFSAAAGLWAVMAFSLAPIFSVSHASWVLPDGPAIFFMLATAIVVARVLLQDHAPGAALRLWVAAGVLGGLAILAKYNAAFVFVGALAFVLTVPSARRHLKTPGPWLGAATALIVFSPVIIWNLDNDLSGYLFQSRRVGGSGIRFGWLAENIGGQFLYLTPWLMVPLAISLLSALKGGPKDRSAWFLALMALGPIAVFTTLTLWSRGLPHWSMPGWLFAFALFGRDAVELVARRPRFARRYMAAVAGVFALIFVGLSAQTLGGRLLPSGSGVPAGIDPTTDLVDWRELPAALAARGLLGEGAVVASPHWMWAGKASYALGSDIPVICLCRNPQHFAHRYDQSQWIGRNMAVVIPAGPRSDRNWKGAARYFDRLEPLESVEIYRGDAVALRLEIRKGYGLRFPARQ